ncbi:MAG: inositol monophosphatase family protein, partial [Stellaceae bacterium]
MNAERQALLEAARLAARQAAETILEVYATAFDVRHKADKSPVTLADEEAERLIIAALTKAAPDIPVIAEEQAAAKGLSKIVPPRFWLVDPLDGTKGFVAREDEFTVNIGLVENNRTVLGVVGVPT